MLIPTVRPHQLLVLFGKVVELLGGGALRRKYITVVGLRFYSQATLPVLSQPPGCPCNRTIQRVPTTMPWWTISQSRLFLALVRYFCWTLMSSEHGLNITPFPLFGDFEKKHP